MKYSPERTVAILAMNYHRAEILRNELGIDAYTFTARSQGHRGMSLKALLVDESVDFTGDVEASFRPCATTVYKIRRDS